MHQVFGLGLANHQSTSTFGNSYSSLSTHLASKYRRRSLSIMGCSLSLFTRRKCETSTTSEIRSWHNPSSLYLTWLPQLPASSSKPAGISYPTVRDIPSWLLLSPVDIPSAMQIDESNMGSQEMLPTSPSSFPYLPARWWPSQRPSSIIAAGERVEPIDEDLVQAPSSPPRKDGDGRVSVIVLEPDRSSVLFERSFQTKCAGLLEKDEARESRWTFGSVFAPLDAIARRSIRIHDSILFGLGNTDSIMGMDVTTNTKQGSFEVSYEGDELEARQYQRLAMVNFVLASGERARATRGQC